MLTQNAEHKSKYPKDEFWGLLSNQLSAFPTVLPSTTLTRKRFLRKTEFWACRASFTGFGRKNAGNRFNDLINTKQMSGLQAPPAKYRSVCVNIRSIPNKITPFERGRFPCLPTICQHNLPTLYTRIPFPGRPVLSALPVFLAIFLQVFRALQKRRSAGLRWLTNWGVVRPCLFSRHRKPWKAPRGGD